MRRRISSAALGALLISGSAVAQQPVAPETPKELPKTAEEIRALLPISIDWDFSETITTGNEKRVLIKGNVMARQGETTVRAGRAEVAYSTKPPGISRVVAEGEVTVTYGTKMARADRAEFDNAKRTIVLTGAPTVVEDWAVLAAKEITLHLEDGRVECAQCSIDIDVTRMQELRDDAERITNPSRP